MRLIPSWHHLVSTGLLALSSNKQQQQQQQQSTTDMTTTSTTAMATRPSLKPLILGGGLAGLATALALRDQCASLQVWEASSEVALDDVRAGVGAQLGPNGLRALRSIATAALVDQVQAAGTPLQGNVIMAGVPHNHQVMQIPDTTAADTGLSQVFLRWGVLRTLLYKELVNNNDNNKASCPVTIVTGSGRNVAGYRLLEDGQHVQLIDADGQDLDHEPCNLIIGAEGVASVMRHLVNTKQTKVELPLDNDDDKTEASSSPALQLLRQAAKQHIRDTGRVNLKAVVPNPLQHYVDKVDSNENNDSILPGHTYAWFAPPETGLGLACFAGPAGPGHSYWAISVADDAETGQSFLGSAMKDKHVEDVKLRLLDLLQNGIAAATNVNGNDKATSTTATHGPPAFMMQAVTETDAARIRVSRSLESTGLGESLVSADGHVVLVGDAAHSMALSYGQNPNFALEDAAVLRQCLLQQQQQHATLDTHSLAAALKAYSQRRIARCVEMQRRSDERARKAMKGEPTEDVSKWIFQWTVQDDDGGGNNNNKEGVVTEEKKKHGEARQGHASSQKATTPAAPRKASSVAAS